MYESIASRLQLSPQELEHASLRLFLNHNLRLVESQLLSLARKYGAQTVAELDELIRSGRVHEAEAFEDYFEFDHLEAERDVLLDSLKELA
jgi:hypothetical protein